MPSSKHPPDRQNTVQEIVPTIAHSNRIENESIESPKKKVKQSIERIVINEENENRIVEKEQYHESSKVKIIENGKII